MLERSTFGSDLMHRQFTRIAALLVCASALGAVARAQQSQPLARIDLEQAVQLAIKHNHALKAAQNTVDQSEADEITAAIRPNPVLTYDDLYIPIFSPSQLNTSTLDNVTEFDLGLSYTFERGHKRKARIDAARDATAVTRAQVKDNERSLTFNVAQQFVNVLQAKADLALANQDLASFQQTVDLSTNKFKAGAMSEGDLLKIKLQLLQFQTDVSSAKLALVQSLLNLRQLLGFESVPANYDVVGELAYVPLHGNQEDMQALALKQRPDLEAAQLGVNASESQYQLAKANRARALTTTFTYSHVASVNAAGFTLNMELPFFDRNQGEIARTRTAKTQASELQSAAAETVLTDVANAYQTVQVNDQIVQLFTSGYLKQAQDSRDISEYAYKRGAASLLDYLDAERSFRAVQLTYRQSLAAYMLAVEQVKEAVGTRNLP
jgi:outer membrane protein, heavy metal efflux system